MIDERKNKYMKNRLKKVVKEINEIWVESKQFSYLIDVLGKCGCFE